MLTRSPDARSITRTVRIDEDVQEMLEKLAETESISVNALVNKALRKHVVWEAPLEKFDAMDIPLQVLVRIIGYLSDENAKELARTAGTTAAREFMQLMFEAVNLDMVLKYFELQGQQLKSFYFDHRQDSGHHKLTIRHGMGPKWSIYYEELTRSLLKELGAELDVERSDNQVTAHFNGSGTPERVPNVSAYLKGL
jgi:predicted CopG family antitoxin